MDEKLLEELFQEKNRGAKQDRLLTRIVTIVLCVALLTGAVALVRHLVQKKMNKATDTAAQTELTNQTEQQEEKGSTQTTDKKSNSKETEKTSAGDAGDEQRESVHHELRILWPDEGLEELPETIYFKVNHAGEEVVLLELNARKDWKISWDDSYSVDELELKGKFPEELKCTVHTSGENFIIRMEPNTDAAPAQTSSGLLRAGTEGFLPQTGANWLAPAMLLLAGAGMLPQGLRLKANFRGQEDSRQDVR